jgi:hypothetical protein
MGSNPRSTRRTRGEHAPPLRHRCVLKRLVTHSRFGFVVLDVHVFHLLFLVFFFINICIYAVVVFESFVHWTISPTKVPYVDFIIFSYIFKDKMINNRYHHLENCMCYDHLKIIYSKIMISLMWATIILIIYSRLLINGDVYGIELLLLWYC